MPTKETVILSLAMRPSDRRNRPIWPSLDEKRLNRAEWTVAARSMARRAATPRAMAGAADRSAQGSQRAVLLRKYSPGVVQISQSGPLWPGRQYLAAHVSCSACNSRPAPVIIRRVPLPPRHGLVPLMLWRHLRICSLFGERRQ